MPRVSEKARGVAVRIALTLIVTTIFVVSGAVLAEIIGVVAGVVLGVIFYFSIVINQEYERAVVFRLGGFARVMGPGVNLKIPFLEWIQRVDYRVKSVNVNPQKLLTKDNVTTTVDAVVFYEIKRDVDEVQKAVLETADYDELTVNYAQTTLRDFIGKKDLDDLLQHRDKIGDSICDRLDEKTEEYGVRVKDVEIQDVSIPEQMERAMASQAEAERDRRATIKQAQGELQAAARTRLAADILGEQGYKLRTLNTLDDIAAEQSTVVTIPAELFPVNGGEKGGNLIDGMDQMVNKYAGQMDLDEMLAEAFQSDNNDGSSQ